MNNDPISNLLVSLKNAASAGRASTVVPASTLKERIAELLVREGYLKSFVKKGKKVRKYLELELTYLGPNQPVLKGVKRISRPSRRVYRGFKQLYLVKQGRGMGVVSTSRGVLSGRDARAQKLGGELLFEIW